MALGLYIHIPFCRRKCPYCDFYSIAYDRSCASEYVDVLCQQIKNIKQKIKTVYIGGGTPTVLDRRLLSRLLTSLSPLLAQSKENTIEANPESLDTVKARLFRKKGIDRISIGVQSLRDDKLVFLGRIHSAATARRAVATAKKSGFSNISVDAIYGLPGETAEEWEEELSAFAGLKAQHLSCYSLTCEKNTLFYAYRKKIDQEKAAEMYKWTMQFLPKQGFFHYEVSNFARKGYTCRHNEIYWANKEYLGLGASAFSYIDAVRSRNAADINKYINMVNRGKSPVVFRERLSPRARAGETAAMNIRRSQGIVFSRFRQFSGFRFWDIVDRKALRPFFAQGLLKYKTRSGKKTGLALTEKGFLFADEICTALV